MTRSASRTARTRAISASTQARALVQRAVDKAEQLGLRGAIAVVGASGTLLTASRMDAGGPGGMTRARSKAWISATQQIPSAEHLHRMTTIAPPVATGFAAASPEALFPGAGGLPVRNADGVVVAGIAASGATVSPFFPADVDPRAVSADGRPANPEDLLIAYALEIAYEGQHGDDGKRWEQRFGDLVVDPADSLGMAAAPPAEPPGRARLGASARPTTPWRQQRAAASRSRSRSWTAAATRSSRT